MIDSVETFRYIKDTGRCIFPLIHVFKYIVNDSMETSLGGVAAQISRLISANNLSIFQKSHKLLFHYLFKNFCNVADDRYWSIIRSAIYVVIVAIFENWGDSSPFQHVMDSMAADGAINNGSEGG